MTRLGIYGGSFSPPHLGHVGAAAAFISGMSLDRLLIVPSAIPPHKEASDLLGFEHRLALARLAFSHLPRTEVSDIEIRRAGRSYTYLTLRELSAPDTELFFLCGTDMLLTLDTWRNPEELCALAHFVMIPRTADPSILRAVQEKKDRLERSYGASITLLDAPVLEISSTEIRKAIVAGANTEGYLQPSVDAYIRKWQLYR